MSKTTKAPKAFVRYNTRATIRQKRAIKDLVENGSHKTLKSVMIDAGYSENTAKAPQKLTESKGFIAEALPLIKRLEHARDQAIRRMAQTVDKATYRDTADAIDKLTKNIQLLSGGATEAQLVINISPEIARKNEIKQEMPEKPVEVSSDKQNEAVNSI